MAIATKIMALTLGASGVIVVGCYIGGVFTGEVEWHSLTEDNDFATTYTDINKVGKKYGMYLTGITKPENREWWIHAWNKYESDKAATGEKARIFSDVFKEADGQSAKVTSAYSADPNNTTALNKVCGEAYKKTLTSEVDFSFTIPITDSSENKHKLAADILRYCSPLEEKPDTIQANDSTYSGDNMIGKTKGEEKKLVKVTGNDKFWILQNEWFKGQGNNTSELGAYFNEFFEGQTNQRTLKSNIRDICSSAYKATAPNPDGTSTTTNPSSNDVAKYCAFIKS